MATIRVDVTEEQLAKLQQLAEPLGVSVEEIARLGLQHAMLEEEDDFLRAARRVLTKNEELCRRMEF